MAESYESLAVFEAAHRLVLDLYRVTGHFPNVEQNRLGEQICRVASSVPASLAAGFGRQESADIQHYILVARGAAEELRYHLLLARDLGYIENGVAIELRTRASEIMRSLSGLLQKV